MSIVRLPQLAWHGSTEIDLPLPDDWQVRVYDMAGYDRPGMKPQEVEAAIANPIDSPPIRELARDKNEVVILFDDTTRVTRTYEIVPSVLTELTEAGIPDGRIRFICAVGAHSACDRAWFEKKLGRDVLTRFPVYNHNPFNNCAHVGTTSHGTDVSINAEVMQCDLKIAIGSVVPHPNTGFSGGGKMVLPGVASIETIEDFHRQQDRFQESNPEKQAIGMGLFDENPLRLDAEEACVLAGLDVKIDAIINKWGETAAIFAGHPEPTLQTAIREAEAHYLTPQTNGENIVIANTFAKANESMMVGLHTAFGAIGANGGDVVLISNAPDGQVTHYLMGDFGRMNTGNLKSVATIPENVNQVIVYSEYPDVAGRGYIEKSDKTSFMDNWDDVLKTLQRRHQIGPKVAVIPNVDIQYFT